MKPRLEALPLTHEDGLALRHMLNRWYSRHPGTLPRAPMAVLAWKADIRDADLMLFAQQHPDFECVRLGYFDSDVRVRMSPWVRFV